MNETTLIRLITPRRGSMATRLPTRFAKANAALIAYVKGRK